MGCRLHAIVLCGGMKDAYAEVHHRLPPVNFFFSRWLGLEGVELLSVRISFRIRTSRARGWWRRLFILAIRCHVPVAAIFRLHGFNSRRVASSFDEDGRERSGGGPDKNTTHFAQTKNA